MQHTSTQDTKPISKLRVKGKWVYFYRAVDKFGDTIAARQESSSPQKR
jgi:hypothetical protein